MGEYERLLKEYKKLAKKADQRLYRLEKYAQQENFKPATMWGYRRAMRDISTWSGEGGTRFNTKAPEKLAGLKAKIADINQFLGSKSSTKKGIKEIYIDRTSTINEDYGTDFTWQEFANFIEGETYKKLERLYGSKTAMKAVGEIQKLDDDLIEELQNDAESNLHIENIKVKEAVIDIIKDSGFNLEDFYG